jgi:putative tricarboxylic transport membrane protein
MRTLRLADLVLSAILLLGGVAALVSVSQMRAGFAAPFQPRLFPAIIGSLLIVASGLLAFRAVRTPAHLTAEWPSRDGARRIIIILASIIAYVLFIDLLGMPIATFAVVSFEVWYLGNYRWHVPVSVGLITTAILYFVFMHGLGLTFPAGPFEP